jgi:hypothetical protein
MFKNKKTVNSKHRRKKKQTYLWKGKERMGWRETGRQKRKEIKTPQI